MRTDGTGDQLHDVAISGVGVVSALGVGAASTWTRLCAGHRSAAPMAAWHDDRWAGLAELLGGPAAVCRVSSRSLRSEWLRLSGCSAESEGSRPPDRLSLMAGAAVFEALEDAGISPPQLADDSRVGCVFGTSKPDMQGLTDWYCRIAAHRDHRDSAGDFAWCGGSSADTAVSWLTDLLRPQGPVLCPVAACATGTVAVIRAAELIRTGECSVVIAGSADASLHPAVIAAFHRLGVLATGENAARLCRPFDAARTGFVPGEGAGALILESAEHARSRGAEPSVLVRGGILLTDPTGITQVDDSGEVVAEALTRVSRAVPGYVNVHGTGTEQNDTAETSGMRMAWKAATHFPLWSGFKGALGHTLGAAGSLETALTVLALQTGYYPGTTGLEVAAEGSPSGCITDRVLNTSVSTATKLSLGFGGHVAALALERFGPPQRYSGIRP